VIFAEKTQSVLVAGKPDPSLAEADIAFGQPDPEGCMANTRLKWVAVSSAGYTRYDNERFKETMKARGAIFTNSSAAHADPCAHHVLAMMLALSRQLLPSYKTQLSDRVWPYNERRDAASVLTGQTVLFFGFGAIGRRLTQLLKPFEMQVIALRRQTRSEPGVRIVPEDDLTRVLPLADHVVNLLPENEETHNYVNCRRLNCFKHGARFYNVGRGTTVDQRALMEALESGQLGYAYLDVTDPEPLPPDHPLWSTRNCYITPHTAGGRKGQELVIMKNFLKNLAAFEAGKPLEDRVF
jgi:phosphoglycerate dehydrogenase-like enzyme